MASTAPGSLHMHALPGSKTSACSEGCRCHWHCMHNHVPPKDRTGSASLCASCLCGVHKIPHGEAHRSSSASARRGSNSHAVRMCCCHCAADAPAPPAAGRPGCALKRRRPHLSKRVSRVWGASMFDPGAPSCGAAHIWQAKKIPSARQNVCRSVLPFQACPYSRWYLVGISATHTPDAASGSVAGAYPALMGFGPRVLSLRPQRRALWLGCLTLRCMWHLRT